MGHSCHPQVVIVDDQPGFREAARHLLEARGYDVVAEAGNATMARDAVQHHEPTAVLLDVRLGDDDGFAVCGEITRLRPNVAVLLTSDSEYEHFAELIAACGACGFVRKSRLARVDFDEFWPSA